MAGNYKKKSVELISLSEWRFWNTYIANKQYPTLVSSTGYRTPQTKQYGVTSVLLSLR